jgi:hypothetical protein
MFLKLGSVIVTKSVDAPAAWQNDIPASARFV